MEIYIDSKFIECFALDTSHELHDELRSFLRKPQTGQKILNFESQEAFEKAALKNPLLEMLLESSVPTLNASFQQQMQEDTFYEEGGTKLFFNEDEANDQLEADFGCIFISSKQLNKAYFLFNWHLIPFTKYEPRFTNWDFMSQFRHPCNALIVTDNYLFAKDNLLLNKRQLDENLLRLLLNLMPPKLKIDFHLTIIGTPIDKNGRYQEYIKQHLKDLHSHLLVQLERKFSYNIKLSILIAPMHDRNILTNYVWINSGNSFTYFTNRQLHSNTNLLFHPITQLNRTYNPFYHTGLQTEKMNSVFNVWEEIRNNCKSWTDEKPNENKGYKFCSSEYKNRLLS